MLRALLVVLLIIIFLVPIGIPLLLIEALIGKISPEKKDISSMRIIQSVFHLILSISGVKLTVLGRENIPDDRPVLFVSNHRSYFDIVIAYTLVPGLTGFIAKKEMGKIPLLSHWMKNIHCQFLDRENIKEGLKTILAAIDQVKKGISVWICPEGTRSQTDEMLPFRDGSFKIAEKSGCPVVPVAFVRTNQIYEDHRPFLRMTRAAVQFAAPIEINELSKDEKKTLSQRVQDQIHHMYQEMSTVSSED